MSYNDNTYHDPNRVNQGQGGYYNENYSQSEDAFGQAGQQEYYDPQDPYYQGYAQGYDQQYVSDPNLNQQGYYDQPGSRDPEASLL